LGLAELVLVVLLGGGVIVFVKSFCWFVDLIFVSDPVFVPFAEDIARESNNNKHIDNIDDDNLPNIIN
jgi:hypothetical protein